MCEEKNAAPAAVAGPLSELEELKLLNKLIDIGARAAYAHARSNSDDGHDGSAAYAQWRELRAEMGELIRNAYAAPTTQAAPAAQGDALTYEQSYAIRQGHEIASSDAYFEARPQIDNNDRRGVFRAGFDRGWDAARAQAKEVASHG